MMLFLWIFACRQTSDFPKNWWQNDNANPYWPSHEEVEEESEEENLFFGILQPSDGAYEGESGVESQGCIWYATITAQDIQPCEACLLAVMITYEEGTIVDDENCLSEYSPELMNSTHIIGFGEETVWTFINDEWLEFGFAFFEDDYFGWFVPL